jgi:hypothetical protein
VAPTTPTTPTAPKEPAAAPETAKAQVPAKPQEPHKVVFGTGETKRMVEGKTRAGDSAIVLFAAPVDQMFNVRLSSPDNRAILLVYQPGADEPDAGTREKEGAIGWTGVCEKKGDLKLEVRTKSETDLPFRLEIALPTGEGQP